MAVKNKYDFIIVGGGIVGLSVAYKLLLKNTKYKVLLLEKESSFAYHQTGHNSGVIHSGIYYKPNSLKAINCINGYHQISQFCEDNKIKYKITGKIIAARNDDEISRLEFLKTRGNENGLKDLLFLTKKELKDKEPALDVKQTLWVPQTGIVDYKNIALCLAELIKKLGAEVLLNQEVISIDKSGLIETSSNKRFVAEKIITCCGSQSDRIQPQLSQKHNLKILPFRGEYFKIIPSKSKIVKGLIYPVPDLNFPFLGVHFTNDLNGNVEIGPNAILALAREGYKNKYSFNAKDTMDTLLFKGFYKLMKKHYKKGVDEVKRSFSKHIFLKEVNSFIPSLVIKDFTYVRSGIRAQVCDNQGNLVDDFKILKDKKMLHVMNAPSPAATSCLSIADNIINTI